MKHKILWMLMLTTLVACSKDDIKIYEQHSAVYFISSSYSYTFIDDIGSTQKTILLPVQVSGDSQQYDRTFTAQVVSTTAEGPMFELGTGVVKAGEFSGVFPLTLKYDKAMDEKIYELKLRLVSGNDFPEVRLNAKEMTVTFTNRLIKPANWDNWLVWFYGSYSTGWWKFIIEATGRTTMPYWPDHADAETWNMTDGEAMAYRTMVIMALEKYNSTHDEPLKHDDGPDKGKKVVIPSV